MIVSTKYQVKAKDRMKKLNKMLKQTLEHGINKYLISWDGYVQLQNYGYNKLVHRTTNIFTFSLLLRQKLSGSLKSEKTSISEGGHNDVVGPDNAQGSRNPHATQSTSRESFVKSKKWKTGLLKIDPQYDKKNRLGYTE